jgi:hypothetical protein
MTQLRSRRANLAPALLILALPLVLPACTSAQPSPAVTPTAASTIAAASDTATAPSVDGALVAFALPLVERAAAIAAVWPGFWSDAPRFMLLRDQQSALMITPHDPGPEFTAVPDAALPPALQGRVYLRREYPPSLGPHSFSLRFAVGNDTVPALEPLGSAAFGRSNFYLHEAFHGFQLTQFTAIPEDERRARMGEPLVDPAQLGDGFAAAANQERQLLSRALSAGREDRIAVLGEYVAAREERLRNRPDAAAVERRMERSEGTAYYVGCRTSAEALGAPPGTARACVSSELERPLEARQDFPEADARLMRWRLYGTGGALALLLDDLEVESWQARVEQGAGLYELLRQALN